MLTRILVMTISCAPKGIKRRFVHQEFHLVDLERGKIYHRISPTLLCSSGIGTMLSLGDNSVYILGGTDSINDTIDDVNFQSPEEDGTFYRGAARLQIVNEDNGKGSGLWCPIPMQVPCSMYPYACTVLDGKIYSFGDSHLYPQVYDPTTDSWDLIPLSSEFQGRSVSMNVLPDPSANRIILHLKKKIPLLSPSIVAFYPTLGHWKVIVHDFFDWSPLAAIADDVIYFHQHKHPNLFCAYDLKNLKWLEVCWSKTVINGWDITRLLHERFKKLLSLGDNTFCLSSARIVFPNSKSISDPASECGVNFFKFRSERTDSTISLVLLSAHSFILPRTSYMYHMVPLT